MGDTRYIPAGPSKVFTASVGRTVVHDTPLQMHYEYTLVVEAKPTGCAFLDLFARLLTEHGKRTADFYAALMGMDEGPLEVTLATLSGAGICEWGDEFSVAVAEALLRGTDWKINRIAEAMHFPGPIVFARWFLLRYGCAPLEWRWRHEQNRAS